MKSKKGCLVTIFVFLAIVVVFLIVIINVALGKGKESVAGSSSAVVTVDSLIATATGSSLEQALAIGKVLAECSINPIEIIHDEILDHDELTGYRISAKEADNIILYINKEYIVDKVKYVDNILYDGTKALATITDYTITRKESEALQWKCMELVKQVLKSPTSAKFPPISEWRMGKNAGIVTVQAYVDADNAFGVSVRSNFQVICNGDIVQSFIFDGQEIAVAN